MSHRTNSGNRKHVEDGHWDTQKLCHGASHGTFKRYPVTFLNFLMSFFVYLYHIQIDHHIDFIYIYIYNYHSQRYIIYIYIIYIYIYHIHIYKGLTPPAADPRFTPVVELDVFLWLTPRPGWGPTGQLPFCLNDALLWTFDRELPGQMCCGRHART